MSSRLYLLILFYLVSFHSYSQVCWECGDENHYEYNSQFWMDPSGNSYPADEIWEPDQSGMWTFYEVLNNSVIKVLFTRTVSCDGSVQKRSRGVSSSTVKVYPNPATESINVEHGYGECILELLDINGKRLLREKLINKSKALDVSSYPKGLYTIILISSNKLFSTKIILE